MAKVNKKEAKVYNFPVVIEQDKDGFFAFCPQLQGCYAQGDTYDEALSNIKEVIELHLEDRKEDHEELSLPNSISLTSVSLAV